MEAQNIPNGDEELGKLNKAIKKRLLPNRQSAYTNHTATSKLMNIEKRFVRHRDRRAFNFSKSDAKYLADIRKILKRRRRGIPSAPRAGSKSKSDKARDRLLASLNERRPPITKESTLPEMQQVRIELLQKKKQFPKEFGEDEREYLKRVNNKIGGLRRNDTNEDMRRRQEKVRATTSKAKYARLHIKNPETGMSTDQENRLSELYYGSDEYQPVPMGAAALYSFLKDGSRGAAPSAKAIQKWLNSQKLQQVFAPRRLEHQGDVKSFQPTAPFQSLSMDLASYLFGKKELKHRKDHGEGKAPERFNTKFGAPGYVLGVCDNFSRYLWTRAISNKDASTVASALESIIADVRRDSGNPEFPIKYIQMDDGGEFKGDVEDLLKQGGKFGVVDDTKSYVYTTREENETPAQLAKYFKVPVASILKLNDWSKLQDENKRTTLKSSSKFEQGTEVNMPDSKLPVIRMVRTVGGAPASNGLIERIFLTLKRIIKKSYVIRGGSWRTILKNATLTYNEHHHRSINMTPRAALFSGTKPEQKEIRASIYHSQVGDHTEVKPPFEVDDKVRLRILAPTFNRGSKQSYYSTVFSIKRVVRSSNPTRAVRYELQGGRRSAADIRLLDKTYTRKHLLPIKRVENEDVLLKNPLLKKG